MTKRADVIKEALSHFEDFQHVVLGTIDGDRPVVRPMTLIYFKERFWMTTDTKSEKIRQIQNNPNVEFCLVFTENDMDCCLRVSGVADIIKNREAKAKIAGHCDFFRKHWESIDDPNFTLLEICPAEIKYVKPDKTTRIKLKNGIP